MVAAQSPRVTRVGVPLSVPSWEFARQAVQFSNGWLRDCAFNDSGDDSTVGR